MRNLSKKILFVLLILISISLIVVSIAQATPHGESGLSTFPGDPRYNPRQDMTKEQMDNDPNNLPQGAGGFAMPQEPGSVGMSGSGLP